MRTYQRSTLTAALLGTWALLTYYYWRANGKGEPATVKSFHLERTRSFRVVH